MVNQLRSQITSLEVVDLEDLPGPVAGLLLHSQHLEGSQSHTMLIALLRKGKTLYWVNISTHTDEYLRLADELRAMIEGFVPEDEPEPAPDPDPPPLPRTLWPPAQVPSAKATEVGTPDNPVGGGKVGDYSVTHYPK